MASSVQTILALVLLQVMAMVGFSQGQGLVPGVMIFGDSIVNAGNNNNLITLMRANFPPYGRDFEQHLSTGRFCNGKLATDFTVENLGFTTYPPPYLISRDARGKSLLNGVNFASAASGYLDRTANLYSTLTLSQQLNYFKEYQSKVASTAGKAYANSLTAGSIYILSAGSSDYAQNYYINPLLSRAYTPDQFADMLIRSFTSFVKAIIIY